MRRPFKNKRPIGPLFGDDSVDVSSAVRPLTQGKPSSGPTDSTDISGKPSNLETYQPAFDDSELFP